jgi:glyoxylase-like metal-dependent hydrolase (beta-lactamase superfamily II)
MLTETIATDTHFLDLEHLGRARVIGACLLESEGRRALVDPGPGSALPVLLARLDAFGVGPEDLTDLLLTHIHLDHAGVSGALVARNPRLRVWVHARGAPHLIDPSRLVSSARRLWGDELDRLWGDCLPIPADNLTVLSGGEEIALGARRLQVADTPGHASHHVCYFEADTATAFVGDTAGVRVTGTGYALPPTPPPDIDLEAWAASLDRIAAWAPRQVVVTHFGAIPAVEHHLAQLRRRLQSWGDWARELVEADLDESQRGARFVAQVEAEVHAHLDDETAASILQAAQPDLCWLGLARYWRRRA